MDVKPKIYVHVLSWKNEVDSLVKSENTHISFFLCVGLKVYACYCFRGLGSIHRTNKPNTEKMTKTKSTEFVCVCSFLVLHVTYSSFCFDVFFLLCCWCDLRASRKRHDSLPPPCLRCECPSVFWNTLWYAPTQKKTEGHQNHVKLWSFWKRLDLPPRFCCSHVRCVCRRFAVLRFIFFLRLS